jgi:hypothetical protein
VVITKSNGTVIFANRMTTGLLGWPAGELVGQPVDVLVTEAHRPLVAVGAGWHDVTARHRAGEDVPVELWVAEEGSSVVIVARDRRPALADAAEAALSARHRQQAERLDGLAELAGSLAHEFNNLLAVILSSVGFVSEAVTDLDGVDADLERIRDAAERGARLTPTCSAAPAPRRGVGSTSAPSSTTSVAWSSGAPGATCGSGPRRDSRPPPATAGSSNSSCSAWCSTPRPPMPAPAAR